jgi:uncharacterized coiled-coil DUF342 family protein
LNEITSYKLPKIKQALDILDEAVGLLESSARQKHDNVLTSYKPVHEVEEKEKLLSEEIVMLKAENNSLKKITTTVSDRLDNTIDKLKEVLDS